MTNKNKIICNVVLTVLLNVVSLAISIVMIDEWFKLDPSIIVVLFASVITVLIDCIFIAAILKIVIVDDVLKYDGITMKISSRMVLTSICTLLIGVVLFIIGEGICELTPTYLVFISYFIIVYHPGLVIHAQYH